MLTIVSSPLISLMLLLVKRDINNDKMKNATLGKNIETRYITSKTPIMIRMPSSSDDVNLALFMRMKTASVITKHMDFLKMFFRHDRIF